MVSAEVLSAVLRLVAADAGALDWAQDLAGTVTVRRGRNAAGRDVVFLLNYSKDAVTFAAPVSGRDALAGGAVEAGAATTVAAWDVLIIES